MKIKSKAPIGFVREANQAKYHAFDRLSNVQGDTLENSIDRLRLLVIEAKALIEEMEADLDDERQDATKA